MPKTTPKEDATLKAMDKNPNAPRYVSCDLSVKQKRELDEFIEATSKEDLMSYLVSSVMRNHSFSVRVLEVGYQCAMTGTKGHVTHENICLISRSSTPERAMYSVMFKDIVILGGTWPVSNRLEDLD